MPRELIWSQHPQEAKEHRSFFPFKVSSGGIKRHSLTTHSQTGEVSINVNLAALAAVFLQFVTTLATRFPRLKGRPRKAGSSPLDPSPRVQGTPLLQTHTAMHTKVQHPPRCRLGRRVFEVVGLSAAVLQLGVYKCNWGKKGSCPCFLENGEFFTQGTLSALPFVFC